MKKKKNNRFCIHQLNSMVIEAFLSQSIAIATLDTSINNDIATSISHTYCYGSRLKELSPEATLVLSNTRELDRVSNTK